MLTVRPKTGKVIKKDWPYFASVDEKHILQAVHG